MATTKVIQNEKSAAQNVAAMKANTQLVDEMVKRFAQEGILKKGNKGIKVDIYRPELYAGLLPEEKKAKRRQWRKITENFFLALKSAKGLEEQKKIAKGFYEYYCAVYSVNDFSVNSIAGGRIDENTRSIYEKYLPKFKELIEK